MNTWPYFEEDEIAAVANVLTSGKVNYWTGTEGRNFEQEFAAYFGSEYAVAVGNGTLALELALRALDIGAHDEVIVPSRTFIATASAVVMVGAKPIVADVDYETQNITVETIQAVMTPNTKAIIVVHLGGWPCDMDAIIAFAKAHQLKVIEDCAQAIGAKWKGRYVGTFGDIGAFSFCQDKIISTGGEGGMVMTHQKALWDKMWSFKDHGKKHADVFSPPKASGFRWLHSDFGSNYRMTEMQAAIGRIQLRKLSRWIQARQDHAAVLMTAFEGINGMIVPKISADIHHAFYRVFTLIDCDKLKEGWSRNRIMNEINQDGFYCNVGSCSEIYREEAFKKHGLQPSQPHKNAQLLSEMSLVFLVHPTLNHSDLAFLSKRVASVMASAVQEKQSVLADL